MSTTTKQDRQDEKILAEKTLLETLRNLGGVRVKEDEIERAGTKIVLPERMTIKAAVQFLEEFDQAESEMTRFSRTMKYRPHDGAVALERGLRAVFGSAGIPKARMSMFGPMPPELLTVNVGVNDTIQVPWGDVAVPLFGADATLRVGTHYDDEMGPLFSLIVFAERRFRTQVEGLFRVVEDELERNSIYRGKAITGREEPEFMSLDGVNPDKVIYSQETITQLRANVWSLIEQADVSRDLGLPLKRAVLLEGPYGCGKTLAAFLTAKKAVENDWTFLYCRPGKDDLDYVMQTAKLYQPCVVFFEDVDVIADSKTGSADSVSRLLDMFDGITAKGTELLAVLTTNHADRIHKGMVRPGRLDAVVPFGALDAAGIEGLIRACVPAKLLSPSIDWAKVAEANKGYLPAFVKEAADRTMRYAIVRTEGKPSSLTTEDFVDAADGLRAQLALMEGAGEHEGSPTIDRAISEVVQVAARNAVHGGKLLDYDEDEVFTVSLPNGSSN